MGVAWDLRTFREANRGVGAEVLRGQRGLIVPGHPGAGVGCDVVRMTLERNQVLERGRVV